MSYNVTDLFTGTAICYHNCMISPSITDWVFSPVARHSKRARSTQTGVRDYFC